MINIKALISEHTAKLHSLAYEKMILTERCEALSKEIIGMTGVINALVHVDSVPVAEDAAPGVIESLEKNFQEAKESPEKLEVPPNREDGIQLTAPMRHTREPRDNDPNFDPR